LAITYHAGRRIQAVPNEYKVHEFTSSGTLAVTGSGDIEYLVVAGGGGGYCGGGGAGGMRTGTLSVSAGNKTVTVGAGGYSGQCNVNGHGNNGVGGNSVFDSITSTGGGFGGGGGAANNTAGGSSGGAGGNYTSNGGYPQDSVTPNQGNNGGASDGNNSQRAGAGGGAGAVGGNATAGVAVGGDGLASSISGSSVIYAGGGGGGFANSSSGTGGQGGSGGGGSDGAAGTTNLGAGGGGHDNSARAGYGGSGIVIVRYLTSSGITATGGTITTVNAHDARPLNVQLGSRLEETDTRKMYYYSDPLSVDDDLTSDKGWVSNTADWTYNATGDYIDFATVRRSTTAQQIYLDVQDSDYLGSGNNLSDTVWTARFKIRTGAISSSGNVLLYLGFSNNLGDSGTTQQSACMCTNVNGNANENNMSLQVSRGQFETTSTPARVRADVLSNTNLPYNTDLYMEMIRDGDTFTLKAYTNEYVSQTGVTATATVTGISSLRYIKAFIDSEQNGNTSTGARLYDMKIYNGVTSTNTAWKELGT